MAKFATTDGPYAETKEQLGGILVLEARDMNHSVQLIAQHPALKYGNIFEIRSVADTTQTVNASEQRRRQNTARRREVISGERTMTVMAWLPCSHGAHWRASVWLAQMFLRGNTTQAKAAYQEFPALWKDAYPRCSYLQTSKAARLQ